MKTFTGFILLGITSAILAVLGLTLQWLNDRWSVFGTAPVVAIILFIVYLLHRSEQRQQAQNRDRRRK